MALSAAAQAEVRLDVRPLFGPGCLPARAPAELIVTVENPTTSPVPGTLTLDAANPNANAVRTVRAVGVNVPPRSRASVRLASSVVVAGNEQVLRLIDARGKVIASTTVSFTQGSDGVLLDATPGSRVAVAQRGNTAGVFSLLAAGGSLGGGYSDPSQDPSYVVDPYVPPSAYGTSRARAPLCVVDRVAETGEILLPRTSAGYSNVGAVLMDTATLTALPTGELGALADYVLSGGSLALIVEHASDLRHPVVASFAGADVEAFPAPSLRPNGAVMVQMDYPGSRSYRTELVEVATPLDSTFAGARSFRGGHLHARAFAALFANLPAYSMGSSADYGSGSVFLLAWNPAREPALNDPWSVQALQRIAALGTSRREAGFLLRPVDTTPVPASVRELLTPRDGVRPALGWVSLGALVYGLFAGPLLFALVGRRKRRALAALPLVGLVALVGCVRLADRLRRDQGRARAVTLIDLHAGMTRGAFRRYMGLSAPDRSDTVLQTTEPGREMVLDPLSGRGRVFLVNERDGAKLQGVALAPWATTVVREEGYQTLGGYVTFSATPAGDLRIVNRLPWALEDVVVVASGAEEARTFTRIAPGASRGVSEGRVLAGGLASRFATLQPAAMVLWESPGAAAALPPETASSAPPGVTLARWFARPPERASAWEAVLAMTAVPGQPDRWAASEPPVLVARVAVPITTGASLQGLRIDRDEVWVRVSGYGGAP
jgi:hypothetical protein